MKAIMIDEGMLVTPDSDPIIIFKFYRLQSR